MQWTIPSILFQTRRKDPFGTHCTVYDESCVIFLYEGVCDQCITLHIHISENDTVYDESCVIFLYEGVCDQCITLHIHISENDIS